MMRKRKNFLPIAIPDLSKLERKGMLEAIDSGWISVGPKVAAFEREFASWHNSRHAIALSSCTCALFLTLKMLGVTKKDYVIVPTITWPSTANVVEQLGAIPLFADVEPDTMNISLTHTQALLKRHKRKVKCIVPVHMSGLPAKIDFFEQIRRKYGIPVVYDAAHAAFSKYSNKMVGRYGNASCFSFYAVKNLTTGEGGMVTTDDARLARQIRLWSYHGLDRFAWKRYSGEKTLPHTQSIVPGYKFNMTDLNAAIGLAQLSRREHIFAKRNRLVKYYNALLTDTNSVETPIFETDEGGWANHLYVIKFLDNEISRDAVMRRLRQFNIGSNIHFYPVHRHYYYAKKYPKNRLPVSEWLGEKIISLPLCSKHSKEDVKYVVDVLKYILDKKLAHRKRGENEQ